LLNVNGIVGIPKDIQIREYKAKNGWMLYFDVAGQSTYGKQEFSRYHVSLWVDDSEKEKALEELKPRSIFYIDHGYWIMKDKGEGRYPFPELRLKWKEFRKLETPRWYKPNR